ncbi:MAG: hypothetical protein ACLPJH_19585 [Myxococcaceae bacterium]
MNRWRPSIMLAILCGCAHQADGLPPMRSVSMSVGAAEAAKAKLASQAPKSFKMLHQVVAKYRGKNYLMSGYFLARKDGSFRLSAAAALGPKLFDVAKVDGHWEAQVYMKDFGARFDPTNLGRAVERIYFLPASGPLRAESGSWVSKSSILNDEDVDAVEEWRDDGTLALRRKRYFRDGKLVVQVDYNNLELVQGTWVARSVHLEDSRGFSLELSVTAYEPGFPVPDDVLRIPGS